MSSPQQLVVPAKRGRRPPRDAANAPAAATGAATAPANRQTASQSSNSDSTPVSPRVGGASQTQPRLPMTGGREQLSEDQINRSVSALLDVNRPVVLNSIAVDADLDHYQHSSVGSGANTIELEDQNERWHAAQQGRVKTVHGLLFLCLNIGNDPPDVVKIEPCAKLECWVDPSVARAKTLNTTKGCDLIAESLEGQYRGLQKEAIYRKVLESSVDDAKQALFQVRKKARDGRVLIHYNGHGMPRATHHGEVWFFDQQHTHYYPLSMAEMAMTADSPSLYVFDCNSAGSILNYWRAAGMVESRPRDMIICACSEGENLPLNPLLPADILTACLTTPVKMALEWYSHYSHRQTLLPNITPDMVRLLPGDLTNRRTPLGELQWIFTAVTDTIAWTTTTNDAFYPLFRQDVLTKSLFRNYFLADKLLREVGCTPVSHPQVAGDTHTHPMWDGWEVALESILCQLPQLLNSDMTVNTGYDHTPSTFFSDQLAAFEVWVRVGDVTEKPEQLPSVLLCLNSQLYRAPALVLLCRYLDSGPHAVHHVLFCGALSYLVKLLQSPEMLLMLTVVWLQIMRIHPDVACAELQRAQAEKSFLWLLTLDASTVTLINAETTSNNAPTASPVEPSPQRAAAAEAATGNRAASPVQQTTSEQRSPSAATKSTADTTAGQEHVTFFTIDNLSLERCQAVACYVLSQMNAHGGDKALLSCWNNQILKTVLPLLNAESSELRSWASLLLAKTTQGLRTCKTTLATEYTRRHNFLHPCLKDRSPVARASCATLLGCLIGSRVDLLEDEDSIDRRLSVDRSILKHMCPLVHDPSPAVRVELVHAAALTLYHYGHLVAPNGTISMSFIKSQEGEQFELLRGVSSGTVHSVLTSSRPTDNAGFSDEARLDVQFLSQDEPVVTKPWGSLKDYTKRSIELIVHDAAVLMYHLHVSSDHSMRSLVEECVAVIARGEVPLSSRVDVEAEATMRGLTTVRVPTVTEVDRARSLRNHDLLRQVVLDLSAKSTVTIDKAANQLDAAQLRPHHSFMPLFKDPHEPIMAAQFRMLEPQVVVADQSNRIMVIDYDGALEKPCLVSSHFQHITDAMIQSLMVVNDLAENPLVLAVDMLGAFTLYQDVIGRQRTPTVALSFSTPTPGAVDLSCAYRPRDGSLIYGGHSAGISVVSISDEQVVQTIPLAGESNLTSIALGEPGSSAIFAGMNDGTVRFFDDRTNNSQATLVSVIEDSSQTSSRRTNRDQIVGLGMSTSPNTLFTCSNTTISVFDIRQPKTVLNRNVIAGPTAQPPMSMLSPAMITSSFSGGLGSGSTTKSVVTSFSVTSHYPMMCSMTNEGQAELFTPKLESYLGKPHKAREGQRSIAVAHACKTMGLFGSELISIN